MLKAYNHFSMKDFYTQPSLEVLELDLGYTTKVSFHHHARPRKSRKTWLGMTATTYQATKMRENVAGGDSHSMPGHENAGKRGRG